MKFIGLSSAFIVITLFCCKSPTNIPPNIILIMADDLGYETINANGGTSYNTPNIDAIAANGMRFTHCYAQPLCTPSRVQIMTGIYNVRNYVRFGLLDTSQTTFGHLFQQAGYSTSIIGKWQLGADSLSPFWAGFDEYSLWQVTPGATDTSGRDHRFSKPLIRTNGIRKRYDLNDYGPDVVTDFGLKFIEKSVNEEKPFLLYYPMILTHCPFSPTPDSPEWTSDDTTVNRYKGNAKYFGDMVEYMDKLIGSFQIKLKELDIDDNTLFIFTGDNGTDKPVVSTMGSRKIVGAKGKSTDAGTRVPLFVQWPGKILEDVVNDDLIDLTDIMPTLCDAATIGQPISPILDGQSFWPQLIGKKSKPRDWVYSWYSRNGVDSLARVFARDKTYKLYTTGEFYNVPDDLLEESPLDVNNLTEALAKKHDMLNDVLEGYSSRRLELIK